MLQLNRPTHKFAETNGNCLPTHKFAETNGNCLMRESCSVKGYMSNWFAVVPNSVLTYYHLS